MFSPDSNHFAYVAEVNEKKTIVVDGTEGNSYDRIDDITFSADSGHMAYRARLGDKWFVVLDGLEGKHYDEIGYDTPVFSPDGKRLVTSSDKEDRIRLCGRLCH